MNFLEKIDIIYEEERNKYNISKENTVFSSFIPIEPIGYNTTCGFIIKKQDKSKLLLRDGKQFTFFSDLQVMNTICNMGKEDVEWFLQRFIKLYIGQSSQVQFRLNGEVFNGCGIEKYPENEEIKNKYNENTIELNNKTYKYKYIPLKTVDSTGKSYRVNIYDFNGSSAKEIYANLRSIINKAEKKEIVLRKEIPSENTEDSVKLTTSINDENAGFTCYIKKSDTEYWIKTEPYKNKKAVFIIDGNTGKLYYRENILPNDN